MSRSPSPTDFDATEPSAPVRTTKGGLDKQSRNRKAGQSQTKAKSLPPAGRKTAARPRKKDLHLHPSLKRKIRRDALIFAIVFAIVFGRPTEVAAEFAYTSIRDTLQATSTSCHR